MSFSPRRVAGVPVVFLIILGIAVMPAMAQRNRLPGPIQSRERVTMSGQIPGQLQTAADNGAAEPGLVLPDITLVLKPSDSHQAELDNLLAEGEQCIERNGTLDGDEAFRLRVERRTQLRNSVP